MTALLRFSSNSGNDFCGEVPHALLVAVYRYWRLLALFLAVALYLVFGGIIFSAVEGPNEQRQIQMVQQARQDAFDNVTEIIMNMSNLTWKRPRM